jgi:hypothetical protein
MLQPEMGELQLAALRGTLHDLETELAECDSGARRKDLSMADILILSGGVDVSLLVLSVVVATSGEMVELSRSAPRVRGAWLRRPLGRPGERR